MTSSTFVVFVACLAVLGLVNAGSPYPVVTPVNPANPLNDPDLPNYIAGTLEAAPGSIIIPFGTLQGSFDNRSVHIFNFPTYGLVAHLLWKDIPLRMSLASGKTLANQTDFNATSYQVWPPGASATPVMRSFDGGSFIVDARFARFAWVHIFDYVNGSARLERAEFCETNSTVVHNTTVAFTFPVRYNMTTKPFISVMDSASAAIIQIKYLRQSGFVWGQHYKQMNYAEANAINEATCVTYISEPHFKPGANLAQTFQTGMRQFVNSGGNFIGQCGGIGTYEQCDQNRDYPVDPANCPNGFLASSPGGFRINPSDATAGTEQNYAPDTLFGQYVGAFTQFGGDIHSLALWSTVTGASRNTTLNTANAAHWVVGGRNSGIFGGLSFDAVHSKLAQFHGKRGGNIFYLTGHEYLPVDMNSSKNKPFAASPAGMRLWLNGALHIANRSGCTATVTLPDGTIRVVGELTIDPCRYDASAPECNTVYECTAPKFSGYYKEGWNYGVELLADYPLSFNMNVTLPNRLSILSIVDAYNFSRSATTATNGGTSNTLTGVHRSLPYVMDRFPRWNKVALAEAITTNSISLPKYYSRSLAFTSDRATVVASPAPANHGDGDSATFRILDAILGGVQDQALLWDGAMRVIHVYTNSTPGPLPTDFFAALNVLRTPIVIAVPTAALKTAYDNLAMPRTRVVVTTFPNYANPQTAVEAVVGAAADTLIAPIITATNALLSTIPLTLVDGSDSLGVSTTPVTTATLNLATNDPMLDTMMAVADQSLNLDLPGQYGVPGGPSYSPFPYTIQWGVGGIDFNLKAAIFWSEFASALPFTATAPEFTNVTVPIVSRLRLSASTTSNKDIFIEVLNITKNGGTTDVWATDFDYVTSGAGELMVKGTYYRTDDFLFRTKFNKYGVYTVNYRVYDRCVRSESTITLTITDVNDPPVGSNFTYTLIPGDSVVVSWSAPLEKLADIETPFNLLRISFDVVTLGSSGTLQVFTSGAWTDARTATLYNVSTPLRFVSTSLSSVNASFPYSVVDGDGLRSVATNYARFEFLEPPNYPPIISVIPSTNPTLTTPQDSAASFSVTVTDVLNHVTTKLRVETVSVAWSDLVTLRPASSVDSRSYSTFDEIVSGTELISLINLAPNANNNTATFNFNWNPKFTAPFAATYSFVLYAEDPRGLISNKVTVVLRTPANIAPVVVGFETPNATPTFSETSVATQRNLTIAATDANLIHTDKLNLTISSLPIFGTLYREDCTTLLNVNDVIVYTDSVQPANRSVFPVCYIQTPYASGTDTFLVRATDLAGLPSALRTMTIELSAVNFPPVSANISRSTGGDPVTFTIDSSDPDGDNLVFAIVNVNVDAANGVLVYNATGNSITPGQVIQPDAANSNGWAQTFTYTPNANVTAHYANFTFRVTDTGSLVSTTYWAIVFLDTNYTIPIPPVSIPANFTIPEDISFKINFGPLVNDTDGTVVQIRIETVPANGSLFGPGNVLLTPGSLVTLSPNGSVLVEFVPNANYFGNQTFTYHVIDSQGLRSNTTTIDIEVLSVNDPPTIEATPASLLVERTQTDSFLVSVSDIDSASIKIFIAASNNVPTASNLTSGAWVLAGTDLIELVTLTNTVPGADIETRIDWTPFMSLIDGSSGSFTVYAQDTEGAQSSLRPVLTVKVVDNIAPTIVPTYTYTFNVDEDFTSFDAILGGTDVNVYHREVLDVIIKALPVDGVTLRQFSTDVQVGVVNSTGANGETVATVTLVAKANFNGKSTFTFEVRDLLGALSAVQIVEINVASVNDPPVTAPQTLVVMENLCFSSAADCPNGLTALSTLTPATVSASDADLDAISFTISPPANGTLYFYDGTTLTEIVTTEQSLTAVSGNNWQFFYQPPVGEHSVCVDPKNPSASTCSAFATANFSVTDGQTSVTEVLTLIVFPVNQPPTGENLVFTINEDENLTIVLTVADPDDLASALLTSTTGIGAASRGSLKTTAGADVPSSSVQATEADKTIVFVPVANDFSGPNVYYTRFFYKVVDGGGLESPEYSVTIYVLPVADEIEIRGDNFIRIDEDTTASFQLGVPGVNWFSVDKGDVSIALNSITESAPGKFSYCLNAECEEFSEEVSVGASLSAFMVFYYVPPANANGDYFANISYNLILRPEGMSTPTVVTLTFYIHVTPVNDPPVLVPMFPLDPLSTVFDEDTFEVIYFEATDIDTPLAELSAQLVHGLQSGVPMNVYACLSVDQEANGCVNGTMLSTSSFELVAISAARWAVGLNPLANVNGKGRFTFVVSDGQLNSAPVVAPITVRPINDAPKIADAIVISGLDIVKFSFTATDIDFTFKTVSLTLTDLSGVGFFDMSEYTLPTTEAEANPCYLPVASQIKCQMPIQSIPSWLELIRYNFGNDSTTNTSAKRATNTTDRNIEIVVDDLGNIDYRPDMPLNDTVVLTAIPPVPDQLIARSEGSNNSIAIGAAIGGLLIGAIAAGLLIFFLRQKAADGVSGYFARMALEMDGTANTSPLYAGATTGGASALYQPPANND